MLGIEIFAAGVVKTALANTAAEQLKSAIGNVLVPTLCRCNLSSIRYGFRDAETPAGYLTSKQVRSRANLLGAASEGPRVAVEGRFFPGSLLTIGWWDRKERQAALPNAWPDKAIQTWLFNGFEQWAPSWSVEELASAADESFVGQIGHEDEADSLTVVITAGDKARRARGELGSHVVAMARVHGRLISHRALISHIKSDETLAENNAALLRRLREIDKLGIAPGRYILVEQDDDKAAVELMPSKSAEYYSGYLWQCYAPRDRLNSANPAATSIAHAYFVWEHTNFAEPDVVRYAMDGLQQKIRFLSERSRARGESSGDLVMLQHLMPESRVTRNEFPDQPPLLGISEFSRLFGTLQ